MTPHYSSCTCYKIFGNYSNKHLPDCPMDTNCSFCGKSPFFCKIFGKCGGIRKNRKIQDSKMEKRIDKIDAINKTYFEVRKKLQNLSNQGYLDKRSKEIIDSLDQKNDKMCDKLSFTPDDIKQAETMLFRLQRIYIVKNSNAEKIKAQAKLISESVGELGLPIRQE